MDHDDLWIMVEKDNCTSVKFTVLKVEASWHHQIFVNLIYQGTPKDNVLLWPDSQNAVGQSQTLLIENHSNICITDNSLNPGDVFKGSRDTVYYYGIDRKRYVFPNRNTYMTWYLDFSNVRIINDSVLATIPLKGNVNYKPGVRMVKIISIPNVYAVDSHGVLRWMQTEEVAEALYGENWAKFVDDLADSFFFNYSIGEPISDPADFNPIVASNLAIDINTDLQILP